VNVAPATRYGRAALVVACAIVTLTFAPRALNPFDIVKWTALVSGAVVLLAIGVAAAAATGRVRVPRGPLVWVLAGLALALVLATVFSEARLISVFGVHLRYSGLLTYLAGITFLYAVITVHTVDSIRSLVLALVIISVPVAMYGLLQVAQRDFMDWVLVYGTSPVSTLGNPNFAAGFFAIMVPLVVWAALRRRQPWYWRAGLAALTVLLLFLIVRTDSDQGIVAGAAGLSVLAVAFVMNRGTVWERVAPWAWGAMSVAGAAVVAVGAAGAGPLASLATKGSTQLRQFYWEAAWNMFTANPILGVGLDRYATGYRVYRPIEAVLAQNVRQSNDAAHNVPLQLLSGGGVLVGVAYVAFVLLVGWMLLRGLRRHTGDRRILLGGVGGAWLAYQVQSLVSIDMPPLLLLHWVLAGAVLVVAGGLELREVRLPWAPAEVREGPGRGGGKKKKAKRPTFKDRQEARRRAAWGRLAAGLLTLVGLWVVTLPFRADLAAGTAQRQAAGDQPMEALETIERAIALAPWEYTYHFERARWALASENGALAVEILRTATDVSHGDLAPPLLGARTAMRVQDHEAAIELFDAALEAEPWHPDLKVEYAEYLLAQGENGRAEELLRLALEVDPDHPKASRLLASAAGG
jgi:putative inorganic carbon (hco3(-)) transporter